MSSYLNAFKNYAHFKGRATRKQYWMFYLVNLIITAFLLVAIAAAGFFAFKDLAVNVKDAIDAVGLENLELTPDDLNNGAISADVKIESGEIIVSFALKDKLSFEGSVKLPLVIVILALYALLALYSLVLILPGLAVTVRRLHDSGKSGWAILLPIIPCIGGLILFILLVLPSSGANKYSE